MKQAKRRILSIYYDYDADETFIEVGLWLKNTDNLTKLDVLGDAIGDLKYEYGIAMEKFRTDFRKVTP